VKIVTSFPGQPLRLIDAQEHLVPYLLAGKAIPFVREATPSEIATGIPLPETQTQVQAQSEAYPGWGTF
jgi:hypothetical protein